MFVGAVPLSSERTHLSQHAPQDLVLWENHAQGNISSLVQEKLTPVPVLCCPLFSNHLKEILTRGESSAHGRSYESDPTRRIISSTPLIRMATVYCQVILLVNIHCKTLTRFNINQAILANFGKMLRTTCVVCFFQNPNSYINPLSSHFTYTDCIQ